ncbi:MAG: DUF89 family protein [Deltaproteobacteria bacterium]|nr:DUF89 family protein [Deltaproteobacteria bacterium]MBW2043195.1 DUF89 family protein [Deltaproteobacteria bacterium]MBW2133357.1 DUF89 family protein [Deltaproteobacteria bacterium]
MKTNLDCLPCFVRQALDAARMATADEKIHWRVLQGVLSAAAEMNFDQSPPVMGQRIHRIIKSLSGSDDPYKELKTHFTEYALRLYPDCKKAVGQSNAPFETALRFAAAANAIDFGAVAEVEQPDSPVFIEQAMSETLFGHAEAFQQVAGSAKKILYLGDNAGEIVFDRLLIEQLPLERVVFVVRGAPVINDATLADAVAAGITNLVTVMDSGSDAPGIVLSECSDRFRRCFDAADLVISKGQGNYETLSDVDKKIFFILKVKCRVIARHIGCAPGSLVVKETG